MSNFTDFFPVSTGGGDSAIVTDPNKLPKIIFDGDSDCIRYNNGNISSTSSNWSAAIGKYGSKANIIGDNTYVTVVNVTGSGYLNWCVSSTTDTASNVIATIKITVDGNVSEISGTINQRSSGDKDRFLIGAYTAGLGGNTSGSSSYNSGNDQGAKDPYSSFPASGIQRESRIGILRPDAFNFPGMPKLKFETDLKVEMKISSYIPNGTFRIGAVSYRLD